jgi:hypothetical protein
MISRQYRLNFILFYRMNIFRIFFFFVEKKKESFLVTKGVCLNFKKYFKNYSLHFYFILIIFQSLKNGFFSHLIFSIRFFLHILKKNHRVIAKKFFFYFFEKLISYGFI